MALAVLQTHSRSVALALRGVTQPEPADPLVHDALLASLRSAECSSLWTALPRDGSDALNYTICPQDGTIWRASGSCSLAGPRVDLGAADTQLRPFAARDAKIDDAVGVRASWASVPGDRPRQVVSVHYAEAEDCDAGPGPRVTRVHFYCEGVDGEDEGATTEFAALVPAVAAGGVDQLGELTPSWRPRRKAVETPAELRCQSEAFVALPSLCAHAPFGSAEPRRVERLIESAWGAAGRSGFASRAGSLAAAPDAGGVAGASTARELTYGEITSEGVLQFVDVLASLQLPCSGGAPSEADEAGRALNGHGGSDGGGGEEGGGEGGGGEGGSRVGSNSCGSAALRRGASVFVDVGSGVGKLVATVALAAGVEAHGIELDGGRAADAAAAVRDAAEQGLLTPRETALIHLSQGDATEPGALPPRATHVFLSNLCFPDAVGSRLLQLLSRLPRLQVTPTLHQTASNAEPFRCAPACSPMHTPT